MSSTDTTTPNDHNVSSLPSDTLEFAAKMFEAARKGDSELLIAAIDVGLPVNLTNDKGNTLLMLAAYGGHLVLTQYLLDRSADPNLLNDLGQSIVAGAVFKGNINIVTALMKKGANPRIGTPNAIQTAYIFGRKDLMEVLGAKEEDITLDLNMPAPLRTVTQFVK